MATREDGMDSLCHWNITLRIRCFSLRNVNIAKLSIASWLQVRVLPCQLSQFRGWTKAGVNCNRGEVLEKIRCRREVSQFFLVTNHPLVVFLARKPTDLRLCCSVLPFLRQI